MKHTPLWKLLFGGIREKLIWSFVLVSLFLFLPALLSYNLFDTLVNKNVPTIANNDAIQEQMFKATGYEQAFYAEDLNDPVFFRDGTSKNLQDMEQVYATISAQIQNMPPERAKSLSSIVDAHHKVFLEFVSAERTLGTEGYGMVGALDDQQAKIENYLLTYQRANYADFQVEFRNMSYYQERTLSNDGLIDEKHAQSVDAFIDVVQHSNVTDKPTLLALLADYKQKAIAYSQQQKMIWGPYGIDARHRETERQIEIGIENENAVTINAIRTSFVKSIGVMVAAIVLVMLLALIFTYFVARSLAKPLNELYGAMNKMEHGDFTVRLALTGSNEMTQLSDAFNKVQDALQRVEQERHAIENAKSTFISMTSHELRSPMTPVLAQLQMLLAGQFGKLNSQQREAAIIVQRNAERLDNIIKDLLEVSRIDAMRLSFDFKQTNLDVPVKLLIQEMKGCMPEKRVSLELQMANTRTFECDPDRIMQVLRNVLNNAIKFSKDNGKVIISVKEREEDVLFSVQDFGMGIKPENLKRIFEPFFQEEAVYSRKHGGTGLGLTICKGIIESQEGKLWVESEKDKGTTVYFTVPYIPQRRLKNVQVLFSSQDK